MGHNSYSRQWELLVQQTEEHGKFVVLSGVAQGVVQTGLQIIDFPQTLAAVEAREIGRGLLQGLHCLFQSCNVQEQRRVKTKASKKLIYIHIIR